MPNLTTLRQEAMRVAHLAIDRGGRSGEKNPLTDARVRQAIWYAIDRQTFARQMVQGGSRVPDAPCYFTQFGCDMARDAEVTKLMQQGGSVTDPDARKKAYSAAIRLITERAEWLPIATYAINKQLNF